MIQEGLYQYYVCICRECRLGHPRADLPARPGVEGTTKCPFCGRDNPGWVVFGPFSGSFFVHIPAGGGRQRVRVVVKDKAYTGYVAQTGMDGKVLVQWEDPSFQQQWGAQWFPTDRLEKIL